MHANAEPIYQEEDLFIECNDSIICEPDDVLVFTMSEDGGEEFTIPEDYYEPIDVFTHDGELICTVQRISEDERRLPSQSRSSVTRDIDVKLDPDNNEQWVDEFYSITGTTPSTTFTYQWYLTSANVQDWSATVRLKLILNSWTAPSYLNLGTTKSSPAGGVKIVPTEVFDYYFAVKLSTDSWCGTIGKVRVTGWYYISW
jgi:hypothetical protein